MILVERDHLHQGHADTIREATVDLALHDHRVDSHAAVVHRDEPAHRNLPGARIHVGHADVGPIGVGEARRVVDGFRVKMSLDPLGEVQTRELDASSKQTARIMWSSRFPFISWDLPGDTSVTLPSKHLSRGPPSARVSRNWRSVPGLISNERTVSGVIVGTSVEAIPVLLHGDTGGSSKGRACHREWIDRAIGVGATPLTRRDPANSSSHFPGPVWRECSESPKSSRHGYWDGLAARSRRRARSSPRGQVRRPARPAPRRPAGRRLRRSASRCSPRGWAACPTRAVRRQRGPRPSGGHVGNRQATRLVRLPTRPGIPRSPGDPRVQTGLRTPPVRRRGRSPQAGSEVICHVACSWEDLSRRR